MPAVTIWLFCVGGAALALGTSEARGDGFTAPAPACPVCAPPRAALPLSAGRAPACPVRQGQRQAGRRDPVERCEARPGRPRPHRRLRARARLVSQHQLDDAADAFDSGDCAEATERATASIRTLEIRPEPYEALGFCDVREGFDRLGVAALERAVDRDPDNWEFRYGLAVVRGSAGLDPRPAARAALEQNPRDPLTRSLVRVRGHPGPRAMDREDPADRRERKALGRPMSTRYPTTSAVRRRAGRRGRDRRRDRGTVPGAARTRPSSRTRRTRRA